MANKPPINALYNIYGIYGIYSATYEQLQLERELFGQKFFKGVKVRHKGSKVVWTIVEVWKDEITKGPRAIIQSKKGYKKYLQPSKCRHYSIVYLPLAVKILFGDT